MVTITTQTIYTTTIMSQYPIPISLPVPSQDSTSSLPKRPTSVSTTSTVGSPFSPNPFSAPFTPSSHLLDSAISPPPPPQTSAQQSKPTNIPVFPAVLDPTLLLSARQLKAEFLRRDRVFARTIVSILAGRIELGILSPANGIGFPFSDKDQPKKEKSSCRPTGWDLEVGFNVHSYRERYPEVLSLVHQDLEIRGFIVEKLDLEMDENGIYIKYSLSLPDP